MPSTHHLRIFAPSVPLPGVLVPDMHGARVSPPSSLCSRVTFSEWPRLTTLLKARPNPSLLYFLHRISRPLNIKEYNDFLGLWCPRLLRNCMLHKSRISVCFATEDAQCLGENGHQIPTQWLTEQIL